MSDGQEKTTSAIPGNGRLKRVPAPTLIFEKSRKGRVGCSVPKCDTPPIDLAKELGTIRKSLKLPEVSELDVIRHFTNLSHLNYGIETGFYPLGSCTMKYNPKVNERVAALPGFAQIHPLQPTQTVPGALEILVDVQDTLKELTGFDFVTLQPVAGAHGELTCLMLIKAYHTSRGDSTERHIVLIPDSAHGTNPASAARCGYDVKSVPTDALGGTDIEALKRALQTEGGHSIAAFMLTNPSTLGLFETNISEICRLVHEVGGLVFCDGANMNAMVGTTRPGDHGFDCMHLNLHKTFSTPHGGGGPGCGAIGIKKNLSAFLPIPVVERNDGGTITLDEARPLTIGRVSPYFGQFLMEVRAYAYLRAYGKENMHTISQYAVLNANYVQARLADVLPSAFNRFCMHECVLTAELYKKQFGIRALDISKRLIDYGFHPPTNYFPLIVPEAIMIEPTETESKETLDDFCDAVISICEEAKLNPELLHDAPSTQIVGRLDETLAVKNLDVTYKWPEAEVSATR